MTDTQGAWVFVVLIVVVVSVLDAVLQGFALHSALAAKRVDAPQLAGLGLFARWIPAIAIWLFAGFFLGLRATPARCTAADVSAIWLGLLYPFTTWPALLQARTAKVSLPLWLWIVQITIGLSLSALGALPCA